MKSGHAAAFRATARGRGLVQAGLRPQHHRGSEQRKGAEYDRVTGTDRRGDRDRGA